MSDPVPVPRPSEPLPTTTQEECDAKVAAAHTEISALCHGKRWLMSIPVRPEADSDTIICDALRALKDRVKILEAELVRRSPSVPTAPQEQRDAVIAKFGKRITELESQRSVLREAIRGLPTIAQFHRGDTPEHPTRYVKLDDVLFLVGWDMTTLERDAKKPVEQIVAETRARLASSEEAVNSTQRDAREVSVRVNGLPATVPRFVGYAEVVKLAGYHPDRVLSVVYHQPSGKSGILTPTISEAVEVTDGTRFSVADTSNA